ncbi:hypothetical protein MN116_004859 [Schistosoma mekongi]|uniref:Origin recognition complex subunit 5 n=1 Tax=Schistosoma mekongi TaxID=38744 RepID=A0AAE2D4V6_SCHME|nr:hypothetical protein MN116_004859 [Schistosoma mekongi]
MTLCTSHLLVGREKEQKILLSLMHEKNPLSSCIVITGPPGSGKSVLVSSTFRLLEESCGMMWVVISCLDSFVGTQGTCGVTPSSYLLELILLSIKCRYIPESDLRIRCEDTSCFIDNLCHILLAIAAKMAYNQVCIGLIFEQAEKLCDEESLVLPLIIGLGATVNERLNKINNLYTPILFTVLVTRLPWEKFNFGTFCFEPYVVSVESYSREQLTRLLTSLLPAGACKSRFNRFVDLLLTVCFPVCRNAGELIHLLNINWRAFDEPVNKGLVAPDDEWGQWKLAQPYLKRSLSTLYLRHYADTNFDSMSPINAKRQNFLELPYLTRFLLIAAFIASHNPRSSDKKLLTKNTSRLSIRKKKQEKEVCKTQTDFAGPRVFPLDRLLAIFYVLVQNECTKVPCTSILMSQIACLTACGLLSPSSHALSVGNSFTTGLSTTRCSINSISDLDPLGSPKYRCLMLHKFFTRKYYAI